MGDDHYHFYSDSYNKGNFFLKGSGKERGGEPSTPRTGDPSEEDEARGLGPEGSNVPRSRTPESSRALRSGEPGASRSRDPSAEDERNRQRRPGIRSRTPEPRRTPGRGGSPTTRGRGDKSQEPGTSRTRDPSAENERNRQRRPGPESRSRTLESRRTPWREGSPARRQRRAESQEPGASRARDVSAQDEDNKQRRPGPEARSRTPEPSRTPIRGDKQEVPKRVKESLRFYSDGYNDGNFFLKEPSGKIYSRNPTPEPDKEEYNVDEDKLKREKERMRQKEREERRNREIERELELERQRRVEKEREKERENKRKQEMDRQAEIEKERKIKRERERQQEKEKELEGREKKQKERQDDIQRENERDRIKKREMDEMKREKARERRQIREDEQQEEQMRRLRLEKERERKRKREIELLEPKREVEEKNRSKELKMAQEKVRQKEEERQDAVLREEAEKEWENKMNEEKEKAREAEIKVEKEKQMEKEKRRRERIKEKERERELKEMERRALEKEKEQEMERQRKEEEEKKNKIEQEREAEENIDVEKEIERLLEIKPGDVENEQRMAKITPAEKKKKKKLKKGEREKEKQMQIEMDEKEKLENEREIEMEEERKMELELEKDMAKQREHEREEAEALKLEKAKEREMENEKENEAENAKKDELMNKKEQKRLKKEQRKKETKELKEKQEQQKKRAEDQKYLSHEELAIKKEEEKIEKEKEEIEKLEKEEQERIEKEKREKEEEEQREKEENEKIEEEVKARIEQQVKEKMEDEARLWPKMTREEREKERKRLIEEHTRLYEADMLRDKKLEREKLKQKALKEDGEMVQKEWAAGMEKALQSKHNEEVETRNQIEREKKLRKMQDKIEKQEQAKRIKEEKKRLKDERRLLEKKLKETKKLKEKRLKEEKKQQEMEEKLKRRKLRGNRNSEDRVTIIDEKSKEKLRSGERSRLTRASKRGAMYSLAADSMVKSHIHDSEGRFNDIAKNDNATKSIIRDVMIFAIFLLAATFIQQEKKSTIFFTKVADIAFMDTPFFRTNGAVIRPKEPKTPGTKPSTPSTPPNGTDAKPTFRAAAPQLTGSEVWHTAKTLRKSRTIQDFWNFAETTFLNMVYWDFWFVYYQNSTYENALEDDEKSYYLSEAVGVARIRQVRSRGDSCEIHAAAEKAFSDCFYYYNSANEDRRPLFGLNFYPVVHTQTGWTYTKREVLLTTKYHGIFGTYGGGGYYVDLSINRSISESRITELKKNLWINRGTRAIIIDYTVYNSNANLFVVCKIVLELPPTGGIFTTGQFHTLKFFRYVNNEDFRIFGLEMTVAFLLLYYGYTAVLEFKKDWKKYFCNIWNVLDVIILIIGYSTVALGAYRYVIVENELSKSMKLVNEHRSLDYPKDIQIAFNHLSTFFVFFCYIKVLKYIRFEAILHELNEALSHSRKQLFAFLFVMNMILLMFASIAYLMYGVRMYDYKSVATSWLSLLEGILGVTDFDLMKYNDPEFSALFFMSYVYTVYFILVHMLGAIVNESYRKLKSEITIANDIMPGSYIRKVFRNIWSCYKEPPPKMTEKKRTETRIRMALKSSGYSDIEIEVFFAKYEVNVNLNVIRHETKALTTLLELRKFDFDPVDLDTITIKDLEKDFARVKGYIRDIAARVEVTGEELQAYYDEHHRNRNTQTPSWPGQHT